MKYVYIVAGKTDNEEPFEAKCIAENSLYVVLSYMQMGCSVKKIEQKEQVDNNSKIEILQMSIGYIDEYTTLFKKD